MHVGVWVKSVSFSFILLSHVVSLLAVLVNGAVPLEDQQRVVSAALAVKKAKLEINWRQLETDLGWEGAEPRVAIFIHAVIGVFPKRNGTGGTWGHGGAILLSMLRAIGESGLVDRVHRIYVGALGTPQAITEVQQAILLQFGGQRWDGKVVMVVSGRDLSLSEFPTLLALQLYAQAISPAHAPRTAILYMHTKGVRRNGAYAGDWRAYMMHMLVVRAADVCLPTLRGGSYSTCGALKTPTGQGQIYAGNFWWATAEYLQQRPSVLQLPWGYASRFAAENFLLKGLSREASRERHYCVHHAHHDMQNCPTPLRLYRDVPLLPLRSHGDCFRPALRPQNQSKADPRSWCHHMALPPVPP